MYLLIDLLKKNYIFFDKIRKQNNLLIRKFVFLRKRNKNKGIPKLFFNLLFIIIKIVEIHFHLNKESQRMKFEKKSEVND